MEHRAWTGALSVDLQHPDEATKQRLAAEVRQCGEQVAAEREVSVRYGVVSDVLPMGMDAHVKAELQAARRAASKWLPHGQRGRPR